jgi:hypothetical protein
MKHALQTVLLLLVASLASAPAQAEEFYLKDGSRLVGTIIGYTNDSFRIQTSRGFVVLERNLIQRIIFSTNTARGGRRSQDRKDRRGLLLPSIRVYREDYIPMALPPFDAAFYARPAGSFGTPYRARPLPALIPPRPTKIREYVNPTLYVNQSFQFTLYKPPTWHSYPDLVDLDNQVIATLGTSDETTLLLVGWEYFNGSNATYADLAEDSLKATYTDYQLLSQGSTKIGGETAYERRFSGMAEGRYWTGWAVYVTRGAEHFTLLGLTSSGQFTSLQEVVLRKVVGSFQFYYQPPASARTARRR